MIAGISVAVWYSCIAPMRLRHRQASLQLPKLSSDAEKQHSAVAPLFLRDPGSPASLDDEKAAFSPDIDHEALTPRLDGGSTPTLALLFKQGTEADLASHLAIPEPAHSFERRLRVSTPPDGREAVWWFY